MNENGGNERLERSLVMFLIFKFVVWKINFGLLDFMDNELNMLV